MATAALLPDSTLPAEIVDGPDAVVAKVDELINCFRHQELVLSDEVIDGLLELRVLASA